MFVSRSAATGSDGKLRGCVDRVLDQRLDDERRGAASERRTGQAQLFRAGDGVGRDAVRVQARGVGAGVGGRHRCLGAQGVRGRGVVGEDSML